MSTPPTKLILRHMQFIFRKNLLVLPNTYWTGHETDLLVITRSLRLIDIEVKVSVADLKRDLNKDKWWTYLPRFVGQAQIGPWPRERREWPPKVWKHYFAVPREIWRDELLDTIPDVSGVIVIDDRGSPWVRRQARENRKAEKLTPADALSVARLLNDRMFEILDGQREASDRAAPNGGEHEEGTKEAD